MKGKVFLGAAAFMAVVITICIYYAVFGIFTIALSGAVAIVCLGELILIGLLGLIPAGRFTQGSTGVLLAIYAFIMLGWGIAFPLFIFVKIFYIGFLIISLVMITLICITAFASSTSHEINESMNASIEAKKYNGRNQAVAWAPVVANVPDPALGKSIRVLVERIQSLPASYFPNPWIEGQMDELNAMCCQFAAGDASLKDRIAGKINEINVYVRNL